MADLTGINRETLRYYEREGLLDAPERNATGYRIYQEKDLKRLNFISRSKELGFSLREIEELLNLTENPTGPRKDLRAFANDHLQVIRGKIKDLKSMEKALSHLVKDCDGKGQIKGCPIAEFMIDGDPTNTKGTKS